MLPAFHGERMQRYGALMADVAAQEIERWPLGEPYPLRPRMQAMTLEIVLRAVFGVSEGPRMDELRRELRGLLDTVTDPLKGIAMLVLGADRIARMPAFRRELERVNGPIYAEIAERRAAADLAERDDIMSLLLQATHEDGSPMSDSELRDELLTLLVAGHETTANALSWAVERLCRHPARMERLTAEVRAGRGHLPAGDDPGDAAPAPGDLDRAAQTAGADGARRAGAARRRLDRAVDPPRPPPPRHLPRTRTSSVPSASSSPRAAARRARTRGSRSAAASAAASARRSRSSRWRSSCASSSCGARSRPRARQSERNYRRAITETPRHDAEVLVGRWSR